MMLTLRNTALYLAALLMLGGAPAWAQLPAGATAEGDKVSLNFANADIEAVIRAIGQISGKNFLVDPRVKGTLNIVTNRPVAPALTYNILLSALRLQGYTAIESNGITKILPEADAKLHAIPVGKDSTPVTSGERLVTQVFQIKHESAQQLLQVVRPLVAPNNTVTVYPGNNTLVVTDYAENVSRIARIIESIDVPGSDAQVIPVRNASAVDLANLLTKLFPDGGGANADPSQRVTIMAEPRSNALLVRSENRSRVQAVRSMAAQLDQPNAATGMVRVVYLKNAEAVKVAETLRAVLGGGDSGGGSQTRSTTPFSPTASASNMQGGAQPGSTMQSQSQQGPTSATVTVAGGIVQADATSNALIITAPEAIYNSIRAVIDQLDRRRAQVYVEALIAEVNSERAAEVGIQWQAGVPTDGTTTVFGGTNFGGAGQNIVGVATNPASAGKGLNFMVGSGPVTIPGIGTVMNLNVLARFLESETKANILSTPSLVTLDNEEAKIIVGRNLPFLTGQYANTGGGTTPSNPFQTIERKDVGLTLRIKPQISEGGTIRLQIFQEASTVLQATEAGPVTSKRSLESMVLADDGGIIALGGLVEDTYEGGIEKVPLLGDIPVLGTLFKYDTRKRSKTNLLIFLRPRIMRDADASGTLAHERYDYIVGKQRTADSPDRLMRGESPMPELPPLKLAPDLGGQPVPATPQPKPLQPAQ
ncbi:type II secretion system secretin GspD [Uliginosibacterium sp. H1]|uniref:type II secretion system secretin GspD n=1 Tax=Uliginosibacterium sp. H1 TaxID=3114757 RepID=UPI002E18B2BB|nr:type II secretion system secretin GspD [Uliginosibacterium sp. H1]